MSQWACGKCALDVLEGVFIPDQLARVRCGRDLIVGGVPPEGCHSTSLSPLRGLLLSYLLSHGLRRGLHSGAASRLGGGVCGAAPDLENSWRRPQLLLRMQWPFDSAGRAYPAALRMTRFGEWRLSNRVCCPRSAFSPTAEILGSRQAVDRASSRNIV
jgi:hypothetical protein